MKKFLLLLLVIVAGLAVYAYYAPKVSIQVATNAEPALPLTVPGVYTANRDDATDILELKDDGSYARNYRRPGSATLIHQGQWTRDGDDRISFTNFAVAPDQDADDSDTWRTSRRAWTTRLIVNKVDVQIVINADRALLYTKRGE
jgi:hypothetical protein